MFIPRPDPFWESNVRYARAAARNLGVNLDVVDFQDDSAVLLGNVERVCQEGADAIIFQSFAATGEKVLQIAEKYHTPAFMINTEIEGADFLPRTKYRYWVGKMTPDDRAAGTTLIQQLLSLAEKAGAPGCHVLGIEGQPDQEASIQRRRGLEDYLKYALRVESFSEAPGNWDPAAAVSVFKQYYAKNPAINVVWCANDNMALAVADAVNAMGIDHPMFIGGVDWDPRALEAIGEGRLQASVGGHFIEGAWAVLMLYDYLKGVDFASEGLSFTTRMPAIIKDNLSTFTYFLALDPNEVDFRHYSKKCNPTRTEYTLDLAQVAKEIYELKERPGFGLKLKPEEKVWLHAHPEVTVANEMDWPPFDFVVNGEPRGLTIDLIRAAAEKIGISLRFVNGYAWAELAAKFKAGEIDVLPAVYLTPERQEFMAFTTVYAANPSVVVVGKERGNIEKAADLEGMKVAIVSGFATADVMRDRYPKIKQVPVENVLAGLKAVSLGRVDAFIGSLGVISHILDTAVIPDIKISGEVWLKTQQETELHMGVLKDNIILRDILQKGLDAITKDELRELRRRWLPSVMGPEKESQKLVLAAEERRWLKDHPKIRLGIDPNWPPIEFLNKKKEYSGISAGFVRALEKRLGLTLASAEGLAWLQVVQGLKDKNLDMLAAVAPTPDREAYLLFTKPYASFPAVIVTRKDAPFIGGVGDLTGKKVGVIEGYAVQEYLKRSFPDIRLDPRRDMTELLRSVSEGELDAIIGNLAAVTYGIDADGLANLKIAAPTPFKYDLCMGVRKDWPELVLILDKGLASMTESEKAGIKNRWVSVQYVQGLELRTLLKWAIPIAGAFVLILLVIVLWNRRLGREVAERKRAEGQLLESEKKTRAMSQAVDDALVMLDSRGAVMFFNPAAERLFGYTADEAMAMDFHAMAAPEPYRDKVRQGLETFARTGQGPVLGKTTEIEAQDRQGRIFPVEVTLSSFQVDDEWFAVGTVRDISQRKQAEALMVEKEVAEEAAARAERARQDVEAARTELQAKLEEIERFNRLAMGREQRVIELKSRINALAVQAGMEPPFKGRTEEPAGDPEPDAGDDEARDGGLVAIDSAQLGEILTGSQFADLMSAFWQTVGISAAIIDMEGEVLAASPWQRACTDFHRANDMTCERCIESDTVLALKLNEGQPFSMYRCKNGLTDCASPVIIGGKHVANAFVGQFFTEPPDLEFFRRQAREVGLEVGPYLEAVTEAPIVSEERLPAILSFLLSLAQTVVSNTVERLRAQRAEAAMARRAEESLRERAAALSLAEDAEQARAEIERYKGRLELLVEERTEELKSSEERSRLLLESAGEGIFGVDDRGALTFINPAALKMLGFPEGEVVGQAVHALFHHSRADGSEYPLEQCPMHASFTDGATHHVDDEVLWRKDGQCFPVEYTSTAIRKDGRVVGAVVSFRDVSERKRVEEEMRQYMDDLERFNRLTLGREEKMIQLKVEINGLMVELGRGQKYKIVEQ